MSTPFFDLIDRIKRNRPAPKGEDFKDYKPFLVPRFMSMNPVNLPVANFLNKFTFLPWDKSHHYELARCLPWDSSFSKYIKGEKKDDKCLKELVELLEQAWKDTSVKRSEIVQVIKHGILTLDELGHLLIQLGVDDRKKKRLSKWYQEQRREHERIQRI